MENFEKLNREEKVEYIYSLIDESTRLKEIIEMADEFKIDVTSERSKLSEIDAELLSIKKDNTNLLIEMARETLDTMKENIENIKKSINE